MDSWECLDANSLQDASRAKFWWGVSFLCNLVAVWFIQPLLALMYRAGQIGLAPAAILEFESGVPAAITGSATTMAEILVLLALLIGIASASKAASMASS